MEQKKIIELKNLSKNYGPNKVLDNISLDVYDGEFLTLLGPSGCGKTTILRSIAGFETASSGEIYIDGQLVNDIPANKRNVRTTFQSYALFPHMSVFDNVAFGPRLQKLDKDVIEQKVMESLAMVKLEKFADRKPHQLSGGQQQRVAIARAVVNEPLVLLLDEPLSALDYKLRKDMQIELKQLQRQLGITFIFVTHDQEEALSMSDRIVVLDGGHISQIGTPKEIYEHPQNLFAAKFIGEINIFDGQVEDIDGKSIFANVEGTKCEFTRNGTAFNKNDKIKVLVRPEDFRLAIPNGKPNGKFVGKIEDVIYKGTTVDFIVSHKNEKRIVVSEFFNNDTNENEYNVGQKIAVGWENGWEVVLHDA